MRSFLLRAAAGALPAALAVSPVCSLSDSADAAYSAALAAQAAAPAPRATRVAPRPLRKLRAAPSAPVTSGEDAYASLAAASARGSGSTDGTAPPAAATIATVMTPADGDALTRGFSIVGVSRGTPAVAADALASALSAAAEAGAGAAQRQSVDGKEGGAGSSESNLRWVLVSDATPSAAASRVERALRFELPTAGANDTVPRVIAFEGSSGSRRKWIMPTRALDADSDAREGGGGGAVAEQPRSDDALALALVPFPTEIALWLEGIAAGDIPPTLLGADRPPGDALPAVPHVTVVTSSSFDELVLAPAADVVLESYLSHCPMCAALSPRLRMAAHALAVAFPHAPLRVAVFNVDENERPSAWVPGPAFPTIQLFTAASKGGRTVAAASAPAAPPPAIDFTHPTVPGKMALPSVAEIVRWVCAHATTPLDVDTARVPLSAFAPQTHLSAEWAESFRVSPGGEESGAGVGVGDAPLTQLLSAMDAESRVLEAAVFDSLFYDHMLTALDESSAPPAATDTDALNALTAAARAHAGAMAAWVAGGNDIRLYDPKAGPVPALGGLPVSPSTAAARAAGRAALRDAVQNLRSVAIDGAAYGVADAAWAAMQRAADAAEDADARVLAREWIRDQDDLRAIVAAMPLATALIADSELH